LLPVTVSECQRFSSHNHSGSLFSSLLID
jgi:hypothetical protein